MNITDLVGQHAEQFAQIPNAGDVAKAISDACKAAGFSLIANSDKDPEYLPKSRYDEIIGQREALKTQVAGFETQIAELSKSAKGNEALTTKLQQMQSDLDTSKGKLQDITLKAAVKVAAATKRARDPEDVLKMIDLGKLQIAQDGETVIGLDEQLKGLTESKPYLFDGVAAPRVDAGSGGNPPGTAGSNDMNAMIRAAAGRGANPAP